MGNKYFDDGQEAEYDSHYVSAVKCFAVARTFYEACEDAEGLELANESIRDLLEYMPPLDTFDYWTKYSLERVEHFIQINRERKKLFGLECEYEDPIFDEMRRKVG